MTTESRQWNDLYWRRKNKNAFRKEFISFDKSTFINCIQSIMIKSFGKLFLLKENDSYKHFLWEIIMAYYNTNLSYMLGQFEAISMLEEKKKSSTSEDCLKHKRLLRRDIYLNYQLRLILEDIRYILNWY